MKTDSRTLPTAALVLAFVLFFNVGAVAQSPESIGETWDGANSPLITRALKDGRKRSPAKVDASVVTFKPAGDSGVAKALADALGGSAEQKEQLAGLFQLIKQAYETEVAKQGQANNLAAALTFFIASNVAAYHQSGPSDKASEELFGELQTAIAGVPEFARMSDSEKQKMHDWLVMMAGFVMVGFPEAKQKGDQKSLDTYRQLSDYLLRLVLGVEAGKLSFSGEKFVVADDSPPPRPAEDAGQKIAGVWSKSASSPWGLSPGAMATNAGYYKGQYNFGADGSYSFKGESWGGYLRSNEFWTIVESGVYSVEGDALTITPKSSTATLRNREGVVSKTQNNQLEKMTYRWKLHYFEGIREMNLVLVPTRPTTRDGSLGGNSAFPDSYLYGQNKNLEWRF
jgi:hypothetical protein